MNASQNRPKARRFLAETHEVVNVSRELGDYNVYLQDAALLEAVRREGAGWAHDDLIAFGRLADAASLPNSPHSIVTTYVRQVPDGVLNERFQGR